MATAGSAAKLCRVFGPALAALPLLGAGPGADLPPPTLQDMQITSRVLRFQEAQPPAEITVAVAYDPANPRSHDEAAAVAALLGPGLAVGGLTLRGMLVDQTRLAATGGYDAVFAAEGVNEALLAAALDQRKVPCLTRHLDLVEHGACTVAIRSAPSVSIVLSARNASASGIRFATAFRMMVREI